MILYFLRHGRAEQDTNGPDAERRLTKKGIRELTGAGPLWRRLKLRPQLTLSSPLVRARQTAELAHASLGLNDGPLTDDRLRPGATWENLARAVADHHEAGRLMFVGHNPDFEEVVALLSGATSVRLRPGGVACLEFPGVPEPGAGEIAWLLDPDLYVDEGG